MSSLLDNRDDQIAEWLRQDAQVGSFVKVPTAVYFLSQFLPSFLRSNFDSEYDVFKLILWWEVEGKGIYPLFAWTLDSKDLKKVHQFLERSDLEILTEDILSWLRFSGPQDPGLHSTLTAVLLRLESLKSGEGTKTPSIPLFLSLIYQSRTDLQREFNIHQPHGFVGFILWWESYGSYEYPGIHWNCISFLRNLVYGEPDLGCAPAFLTFYRCASLGSSTSSDFNECVVGTEVDVWIQRVVPKFFSADLFERLQSGISLSSRCQVDRQDRIQKLEDNRIEDSYRAGVNIVGFPQGVLGLGEDARMAARALIRGGIECCLVDVPIAGPDKVEHSMASFCSDHLRYCITNFCLPPPEMMRLLVEGGRDLVCSSAYNIGSWPWELPKWPSAFSGLARSVDEIWAQSRYVMNAYADLQGVKILPMPMVVELPTVTGDFRSRLGIDVSTYVYYLMFDCNSGFFRKNPLAGVRAFKKAFDGCSADVALVVKVINSSSGNPFWQELLTEVRNDSRLVIVQERLERQSLVSLMASCDCYISLHRSEGFGRVIAEAMLLGQPVVVSNFSGNVDYCFQDNSYLVDGRLIDIRQGEYIFYKGQQWFEPNEESAVEQIRKVYFSREESERVGRSARETVAQAYSVENVSRCYLERLASLGLSSACVL